MARLSLVVLFSIATIAVAADATEIVVQNDDGSLGNPQRDFTAGSRVGAFLTAPVDGTIVGVIVMWGSLAGGGLPVEHTAISISSAGYFDVPGTGTLATIVSPILVDGGANEFRFLDPGTDSLPLTVPVTAGQTVLVDLEYMTGDPGGPVPGLLKDAEMQAGKNAFFIPDIVTLWSDPIVVTQGDFAIRAIIEPVPEPSSIALATGILGIATVCWWRSRKAQRNC